MITKLPFLIIFSERLGRRLRRRPLRPAGQVHPRALLGARGGIWYSSLWIWCWISYVRWLAPGEP